MLRPYLSLLILLAITSCGEAELSPEQVLVQYVQLVNQGQLEAAKQWCTPAAVAHLDALAAVMDAAESAIDSTAVQVEILLCETTAEGLQCEVEIHDGFGPYVDHYQLVHTPEGWRVDQAAATGTTETHEEVMSIEQDSLD